MQKATTVAVLTCLVLACGLAHAVPGTGAAQPGRELKEYRTEFSRTFMLEDGRLSTEVHSEPIHRLDEHGEWQPLEPAELDIIRRSGSGAGETDMTTNVYPDNAANWTGWADATGVKSSDQMIAGVVSPNPNRRGYAKFNLGMLPGNLTITTAVLFFNVSSSSGSFWTHWRLLTSDPVTADGAIIYAEAGSGTQVSTNSLDGTGWVSRDLNDAGRVGIQSGLAAGWVAFGWKEAGGGGSRTANGYSGTNRPYLMLVWGTQEDARVTPQNAAGWSGNVSNTGTKTDGGLTVGVNGARRSWVKFDLSSIPDDTRISGAVLGYWINGTSSGTFFQTHWRKLTTDPVSAPGTTIWDEAGSGTIVTLAMDEWPYTSGSGWSHRVLNSAGVQAVREALSADWLALGWDFATVTGANRSASGYSGGTSAPFLRLFWDQQGPACPRALDLWTGTVSSAGTKTNGNLTIDGTTPNRGWAKFDLSCIPDGIRLDEAWLNYYILTAGAGTTEAGWTHVSIDPVTATGTDLYNAIGSGTVVSPNTFEPMNGCWALRGLNAAGRDIVRDALAQDWVAFGWNWKSGLNRTCYGWSAASGNPSWPYLNLVYYRLTVAPALSVPANLDTINARVPAFQWQPVAGANVTYRIQVDDEPGFNPPVLHDVSGLSVTTWSPPSPGLTEGTWFWRVLAADPAGEGPWSGTWNVSIDVTPPAVPDLQAPPADTIGQNRPTFDWLPLPDARRFNLALFDVAHNPVPGYPVGITQAPGEDMSDYTPTTPLSDAEYYWQVEAVDRAGNSSGYSAERWFSVDATAPPKPTLIYPIDDVTISTGTPRLDWEPIPEVRRFNLQLYNSARVLLLSKAIAQAPGEDESEYQLLPAEVLPDQANYAWCVEALDYANNTRGFSEAGFRVERASGDVGVVSIGVPQGCLPLGGSVTPTATWRNYGNEVATFEAWMTLTDPAGSRVYSERIDVAGLAPRTSVTVNTFPPHVLATPGFWSVRCSTYYADDQNPGNDQVDNGFFVANRDVGVVSITVPQGRYSLEATITPTATWRNNGGLAANFEAWMIFANPAGNREYSEKLTVPYLAPEASTSLAFPDYTLNSMGSWTVRCSTYCTGDEYPGNDVADGSFLVQPVAWPDRWTEARPMAHNSGDKAAKDGAWLAVGPDRETEGQVIYVAKGNKTTDFFRYYPVEDSWVSCKEIPTTEGTKTKPPSKGCVGVSDGQNYVYMTKGNNTLGFWRYDIAAGNWESLPGVPIGRQNKRVKGGTDMVYVPASGPEDTGWVYLLKGYKTEFYRFNTKTQTWDLPLPEVPAGGGKQKYDKGSFLVYNPAGSIYAHQAKYYDKASGYHYMFRYDLEAGNWADTLKGMPLAGWHGGKPGKNKKTKDGAAGDWYAGNVYAVKGGNTQQFFRYFADNDSWQEIDTIPSQGSTGKRKYIKQGGDLVSYGYDVFFTLKGNKTFELWRYVVPTGAYGLRPAADRSGAQSGSRPSAVSRMLIAPNPLASGFATVRFSLPKAGPVAVTVFDIAGRSVLRQSTIGDRQSTMSLDLRKVPAGVYLVRLDAGSFTATQKLVVQR